MDTLDQFVSDLSRAEIGGTVNPYSVHDPELDRPGGAAIRTENLLRYLKSRPKGPIVLVGEAAGYRGCRFSGIAFTSERSLPMDRWSSTRERGWQEPSATTVHSVLHELGLETRCLLWNTVPTHPSGEGSLSNRRPRTSELVAGIDWLNRLFQLVRPSLIIAIGQTAREALPAAQSVRHPSYGGARLFAAQLRGLAEELRGPQRENRDFRPNDVVVPGRTSSFGPIRAYARGSQSGSLRRPGR